MTPKSSKHINIDEILLEMAKPLLNNNDRVFVLDTDIKEAKQQLYDLMLEIIGSDEPSYTLDNPYWERNRERNHLRDIQRQKLADLSKGDNE